MAPVTNFAVKDPYGYLDGLGNYLQSEAFPGAVPLANNSPQNIGYGLCTERISGNAFTAPREQSLQTWLYRSQSSYSHGEFVPLDDGPAANQIPKHLTPNKYLWPAVDAGEDNDWRSQKLLGANGDPAAKQGFALWVFDVSKDLPDRTVFCSLDGDALVIVHNGTLDIQTELGRLLVRQNEIAVIPRGIRYRVTLPTGPTRGFIFEVFQGHFRLPNLGVIGSTGLANIRDFQIPTASYDGKLSADERTAVANNADWTLISRLNGRLWTATQDHTPFDVAGWQGTCYPYKYDLGRFCPMGNTAYDIHDPSLFTVLTVPSHGEPGTAVVDFAVITPRWVMGEDTYWLPYYHRNTMSEFFGPVINDQNPQSPLNQGKGFKPFVCGLHGSMGTHGASVEDYEKAMKQDTSKPGRTMDDGFSMFLLETERPLFLTDWAYQSAVKNPSSRPKPAAKM